MFGSLKQYSDVGFWQEHPSVCLSDEDGIRRYDIFAAYEVGVAEIVYRQDLSSAEDRLELIRFGLDNSVIETGIVPGGMTAASLQFFRCSCMLISTNRQGVIGMRLLLKVLAAPVIVALTVFVWLCVGVVYCAGMVMSVAGWIAALLGVAVMLTYSVKNGIVLLVIAFLLSPMGLPAAALWLLGKVQDVRYFIQDAVY